MADLPRIRRFLLEDFQSQKEWIGPLFESLNQIIDTLYSALNKGLTFRENVRSAVRTLEFTQRSNTYPLKFPWGLRGSGPTALIVVRVVYGSTAPTTTVGCDWEFDGTNIVIKSFFGLTPDEKYKITVVAFNA
jgi:hypothetical protein